MSNKSSKIYWHKHLFDIKWYQKEGVIDMLSLKKILKTAIGVSLIYMMAVVLTLFMCDRVNELESSEEEIINTTVALSLK